KTVVVVISRGAANGAAAAADPCRRGHVGKCTVSIIVEQRIARSRTSITGQRRAVAEVDIEPAVVVVVQERAPAANLLGEESPSTAAIGVNEARQPAGRGDISEAPRARAPGLCVTRRRRATAAEGERQQQGARAEDTVGEFARSLRGPAAGTREAGGRKHSACRRPRHAECFRTPAIMRALCRSSYGPAPGTQRLSHRAGSVPPRRRCA